MTVTKSILAVFIFRVFLEVIGVWIFLKHIINIEILIYEYYYFINGLIELIFILLFFWRLKKINLIVPKKTLSIYYVLAILVGVSYVFIQTPLNDLYNLIFKTNYNIIYDFNIEDKYILNNLAYIVFFPIAEELFFRGYIQYGLQKKYNKFITISLSTLLFSCFHIPDMHGVYLALFGGLFSAILYYKSQSIVPSAIFHIFWNLLAVIV